MGVLDDLKDKKFVVRYLSCCHFFVLEWSFADFLSALLAGGGSTVNAISG